MKYLALALSATYAFAQKVQVALYYESQCPGCRYTITTSFKDAFAHNDLLTMADVFLYPYGNAHETQNGDGTWTFTCQHGGSECQYNMIEACAQHFITDPYQQFDFIECIEENDSQSNYDH